MKNPIRVAGKILEGRECGMSVDRLGRVRPVMLVGRGAEEFARGGSGGVDEGEEREEMVSPRARREWAAWKRRLEEVERTDLQDGHSKSERGVGPNDDGTEELVELNARQDTVGAVVLDGAGNVAAGVSR